MPVTRPAVSSSAQAAARLLKRISDGFGVADNAKFAGFSAEVINACEQFTSEEVERATFSLLRAKTRPHIGDVYDALSKAREVSKPVTTAQDRSDWGDITFIIAWLCGNTLRWHDWQAEMGEPGESDQGPFIPEIKAADFAMRNYRRLERDLEHIIWTARNATIADLKKLKPFECDMSARVAHAIFHGDAAGFDARLERIRTPQ